MFPLDTLHSGSRVWEAHPRQLDKTPHAMSWEKTLQLRPLVGAQAVRYRIRDGVVDSRGSIYSTPELTLEGRWTVDFDYRRVPRLQAVSRCIIRSWDSEFHCEVWQEQGKFTGIRPTPYTWDPPSEYTQGSKMRARWVLAGNDVT